MKSKIYLDECVENKDYTFGEADQYYPVKVVLNNGTIQRALFTRNQIVTALNRAHNNEEDFPDQTFLEIIFDRG
jgi:hypothetical protein